MSVERESEQDSGLLSLVILAQFLGLGLSPERLRAQVGVDGVLPRHEVVRLARQIGFQASDRKSVWKRLTGLRLPALIERRDGTFFLLAKLSERDALIQDPLVGAPQTLSRAEFEAAWSGRVIEVTRRESDAAATPGWFNVGWFFSIARKYAKWPAASSPWNAVA